MALANTAQHFCGQPRSSKDQDAESWAAPRMDLYEKEDEYIVSADMPGVPEEDIEVRVDNGVLTIQGKSEKREEARDYLYQEIQRRNFQRRIELGKEIQTDAINAELKDGVLTVRLPKSEQARVKRIEVHAK